MTESFFASVESELIERRIFQTKTEARLALFSYIEGWYNPRRRHSALGYRRGKQKCSERDGKSETPSLPIGPIGRKPARSKAFGRLRSKSVPSRYDTR